MSKEEKSIIIPLISSYNSIENIEAAEEMVITTSEEVDIPESKENKKKDTKKTSKKEKKSDTKAKSKENKKSKTKDAKDEETPKESSNTKNRNKNDEYYIKIQYPSESADGEYIKIIPNDKENFQSVKELYHQLKEDYKNEAQEISLIGTAKGQEPYTLHSKKLEHKNSQEVIKSHLNEMINLKNSILDQLSNLQEEIEQLESQKDNIESIIKDTDYNNKEQADLIPNELIRLKHILRKLDDSKKTLQIFKSLKSDTNSFDKIEELLSKL